jgi:pimeloyl-ACP methyl ester carboxylesterase
MTLLGKVIVSGLVLIIIIIVVPLFIKQSPAGKIKDPRTLGDLDSQFIDLNGITLHYKKVGNDEPTLILLHGFGSNLFTWNKVLYPLSSNATVIVYDWIGFGLTTRPIPSTWDGENPYSTVGQVGKLIALMDALGIEKAILVGNSAGALIASETYFRHPERVSGLILVDPALKGQTFSPVIRWLMNTPQMDRLGLLLSRQILTRGDDFIRTAWHDPSSINEDIMNANHKPLQMYGWDMGLWEFTKADKVNVLAKAGQYKLPVIIITGSDDRIIPTKNSIELYRWIPGAELAVIEGAGHVPQEEKPEEFINAVTSFVNKITR